MIELNKKGDGMDAVNNINALFSQYDLMPVKTGESYAVHQKCGDLFARLINKSEKQLDEIGAFCLELKAILDRRNKRNKEGYTVIWNNGMVIDEGKEAFSFESHKGELLAQVKIAIEELGK